MRTFTVIVSEEADEYVTPSEVYEALRDMGISVVRVIAITDEDGE